MAFATHRLQEARWKRVAKVFAMLPGEKMLLVDPSLLIPLDRVTNMSLLRKLGVSKVFRMDDLPPKRDIKKIAYLVPPTSEALLPITNHLEVDRSNNIDRTRLIIFVPQETADIRYLLESKGFAGYNVCTASLSLGWITLDTDLMSLNLPILYSDFFLHGDYTWPQFMGTELGELLDVASSSDLSPLGCRVHAFGEVANVVASGVRLYCIQSGLVGNKKSFNSEISHARIGDHISDMSSRSSTCSSMDENSSSCSQLQPPLVIIFSRDWDYVTPLLVPMTFEALIHEVIGIDLGIVELKPSACTDKSLNKRLLNSTKMPYYKAARDVHISCIHTMLNEWRSSLQDARTGLEMEMASCNLDGSSNQSSSGKNSTSNISDLKYFGSRVGPLLAKRQELSFLLICLEQIMDEMTRRERVEDLRAAQTILLRSGSGGILAIASHDKQDSQADPADIKTTHAGVCGSAADETDSMPIRLALEWFSTHHGDRLIDGIRLAALASVTHDGLTDEMYSLIHHAVLHAAGQAAFPLLFALRSIGLLVPRSHFSHSSINAPGLSPGDVVVEMTNATTSRLLNSGGSVLSTAAARLGVSQRRRSRYNRLHQLLRLSNQTQTNRRVDQNPVSPTYVYSGEHCPVVVRLAESIWAASLLESPMNSKQSPDSSASSRPADVELIGKPQLVSALKTLGMPEEACTSLGLISFADPTLAAAGYQSESLKSQRHPCAPLAHPLPSLAKEQPVVIVFPGGCTYGEVAALRFAAARRHWQLLIATSCLISSRDLLQRAGQAMIY